MISDHIEDYIMAIKAKYPKNSVNRNKAISHLQDVRAHLIALEIQEFVNIPSQYVAKLHPSDKIGICTGCEDGMIRSDCPIHTNQTA